MIELKDLKNRVYEGDVGKCIAWDYFLELDLGTQENIVLRFMFKMLDDITYEVKVIIPSSTTDVVYTCHFVVPKRNMPIQIITASGLMNIQYMLKEEIQLKSTIDFCIGDIVRGM